MKNWQTSGGCRITRVLFGRSNVFLLSNNTSRLLVDTGWDPDAGRLLKRLRVSGNPDAVIMTHTHFDHAGNAGMLRDYCAPVFIVQEREKDFLESGFSPIPRGLMGWTRFIYKFGAERAPRWFRVPGVKADVVFGDRYDLSVFGFNACILHTPGHSAGSSCVLVDNEIALVGDTLGGFIPGSVFPPWGDDGRMLIQSWKKLLDTGCHTFHPAHGFTVSRQRLIREYEQRVRKQMPYN
jgi:hydroxyacylglutathione hydrolase